MTFSSKSCCAYLCLDHCIMLKSAAWKLFVWGSVGWVRDKGRGGLICLDVCWLRGDESLRGD